MVDEPSAAGCCSTGRGVEHPSFTWNPFWNKKALSNPLCQLWAVFLMSATLARVWIFPFSTPCLLCWCRNLVLSLFFPFNTSRLWNIPFFQPGPSYFPSERERLVVWGGWNLLLPQTNRWLKDTLKWAFEHSAVGDFGKKGGFEEIWSLLCHIIMLQTEVLGFRVQLFLPSFLPSRKGGGVITNTISWSWWEMERVWMEVPC